jgi:predicted AAA+ superfamily ATPase
VLALAPLLSKKSHFLFGPRQTGKTSLIRDTLNPDYTYNLLESDVFLALQRRPALLREQVSVPNSLVVVDEIQKVPTLLDEVQWLIEERSARFLLTGSSARKLRRGGVNLLGGRLRSRTLHPFVSTELGEFDLWQVLSYGTLPPIYFSDAPEDDLRAYTNDYLREEIAHEGLTRNVGAFARFLEVAALCNCQVLNFSSIASDAQVPRSTVHEYFEILKDTLLGFELPSLGTIRKRKALVSSKFYFFDIGVARALQGRGVVHARSSDVGDAFEAWLFHELRAAVDYGLYKTLHYWRTVTQIEVDFILNETTAIEVKATEHADRGDLKGLHAIGDERPMRHRILVCREARPRIVDGIEVLPYREFLHRLWAGAYA